MYSLYCVTGVLEGGTRSQFRHENTFRNEATLQGYQIFFFFCKRRILLIFFLRQIFSYLL